MKHILLNLNVVLPPQSNCVSSVTSLKSDWLQLKEHTDQTSTLTATYTLTATLVRAQVLPPSDLYICGSVATRTDADVLYSLSQTARDTIHRQADRFSLCCQWLDKIGNPVGDRVASLPSPARVRRLARKHYLPLSPLVKSPMVKTPGGVSTPKSLIKPPRSALANSQSVDSPVSSRIAALQSEPLARNLFGGSRAGSASEDSDNSEL